MRPEIVPRPFNYQAELLEYTTETYGTPDNRKLDADYLAAFWAGYDRVMNSKVVPGSINEAHYLAGREARRRSL